MKHGGIVLAVAGMLILCILTLGLLSMPGRSPARPPAPQPPLKMLVDDAPRDASTSAETPLSAPQPAPPEAEAVGPQPAQMEGDMVTGPDGCVLLETPSQLAFLGENGPTLMANRCGVYAFNAASGELAWYQYQESRGGRQGLTLGQKQALVWSGEEIRLLDSATGRETWSQHNAPYGRVAWAALSPDESRILACTERNFVFYSVNTTERRAVRRPDKMRIWGWLPDSRMLLLNQLDREGNDAPWKWGLFDADSGAVATTWGGPKFKSSTSDISGQGQIAVPSEDDRKNSILKILDARNGTEVREFKLAEPASFLLWLPDARRLVFLSTDRRKALVIDSETGTVEFSLSREGHRFCSLRILAEVRGQEWTVSQDASNNWYAWPLSPDGAPRMILSGRSVAPGQFILGDPSTNYMLAYWRLEDHLWAHAVFTIEGHRKLAEWHVRSEEDTVTGCIVNLNMTRLVRWHAIDSKGQEEDSKDTAFAVYVRDNEAPVFTGKGRPIKISPDGRYLVVQSAKTSAMLYDLDSQAVACEYHWPDDRGDLSAEFSEDGRRLVTEAKNSIEVTELIEGYPRQTMNTTDEDRFTGRPALSPDGARVLCSGFNHAKLFDADTGAPLRTFEETERFALQNGAGVMSRLDLLLGDWMRIKLDPHVEAVFAENGARVVTCTAGQVIRVWDADSGKLLHSIRTGLPEQRDREGNINNRFTISANHRFLLAYNDNGFGPASLWSLADGALLRQYQLPFSEESWPFAMVPDDASAVYVANFDNLYRWPGIMAGSSHAVVAEKGS